MAAARHPAFGQGDRGVRYVAAAICHAPLSAAPLLFAHCGPIYITLNPYTGPDVTEQRPGQKLCYLGFMRFIAVSAPVCGVLPFSGVSCSEFQ